MGRTAQILLLTMCSTANNTTHDYYGSLDSHALLADVVDLVSGTLWRSISGNQIIQQPPATTLAKACMYYMHGRNDARAF